MQTHDNNGELKLHCWEKFLPHFSSLSGCNHSLLYSPQIPPKKTPLSSFSSHPAARVMTGITPVMSVQPGTTTALLLSCLTNHIKIELNNSGFGPTSETAVRKHLIKLSSRTTNSSDIDSTVINLCHLSQHCGNISNHLNLRSRGSATFPHRCL